MSTPPAPSPSPAPAPVPVPQASTETRLDNKVKPIEEFIHQGLVQRFYQVFGCPLQITNSPNKKEQYVKAQGGKVKYPFAFASISSFALSETSGYKALSMVRRGIYSGSSSDNLKTYQLRQIPVATTFEIEFYTADYRSTLNFAKSWLFSAVQGTMKFSVTYGVASVDIHIDMDKNVNVPPPDGDGFSAPKEYKTAVNMIVHGYMSDNGLNDAQAVTSIEVTGLMAGPGADVQALLNNGTAPQVFYFKSKWPDVNGPDGSAGDTYSPED